MVDYINIYIIYKGGGENDKSGRVRWWEGVRWVVIRWGWWECYRREGIDRAIRNWKLPPDNQIVLKL